MIATHPHPHLYLGCASALMSHFFSQTQRALSLDGGDLAGGERDELAPRSHHFALHIAQLDLATLQLGHFHLLNLLKLYEKEKKENKLDKRY